MPDADPTRAGGVRRALTALGGAVVLTVSLVAVGGGGPAGAAPLPTVSAGYADSATGLAPWGAITGVQQATATYFIGGQPSCCATHGPDNGSAGYDGGAIEINDTTGGPVTVNSVTVDIGTGNLTPGPGVSAAHFDLWGSANASGLTLPLTLQAGQTLVLAQDGLSGDPFNFDTSDVLGEACHPNSDAVPVVHVVVNGADTDYADSHQIINSDGADQASCPGDVSEQRTFTVLQPGAGGQPASAPVNDLAPAVEGTPPVQNRSLTASPGAWNASPPPQLTYQWQRCTGGTCTNIAGATTLQYGPTSADVGSTLRMAVTASNPTSSLTVDSAPTAAVAAGPVLEQFGNVDSGFTSAQLPNNQVYGTVYTASNSGTSVDFRFFARGAGASQTFTPLVYSVVSGHPGTVLAEGSPVTVPMAHDGNWYTSNLSGFPITAGTAYFLALAFGNNYAGAYVGYDNSGSGFMANAAYPPALGSSLGALTPETQGWTFYLDYTPTAQGPPTNTAPPVISGSPTVGSVLTTTTGTWSGTAPIGYAEQWQRCDTGGANCTPITGATGTSYALTSADLNTTLDVVVTASNGLGSAHATSAATAVITSPPPIVTVGNTTVGTASSVPGSGFKFGSVFTTTVAGTSADFRFYAQGGSAPQSFVPFIYSVVAGQPATLLGSGPVITVPAGQPAGWVSGPLTGISLAASTPYMIGVLAGPTGSQAAEFYTTVANGAYWNANTAGYPVPASTWGAINISNQLWDFAVDYTTSGGGGSAPTNTAPPVISGSPTVGSVLTTTTGTWSGTAPIGYAEQWQRCDTGGANCTPITGATGTSYALTSADLNTTLDVVVTASNGLGSAHATSAATAVITSPPPIVTVGNTTVGTASSVPGSGFKFGSVFTTTVAGTSADFRFYAQGGSAPQSFVPFIYSVVAGQPATLLGSGPVITVPAGQPAGWVSGPLTGISLAASTPYMIGVLAGPTGSQAAEFYTTVANGAYWNANTAGYPVPASTWGAINISNQLWDFAVDYTTSGGGGSAPTNTAPPVISGSPTVGSVLTTTTGTWSGTAPIGYAEQWQRCDTGGANCTPITGATGTSYALTSADLNTTLDVVVTASNGLGSAHATSAATAVITSPPPIVTVGNTTVGTASSVPGSGFKFGSVFTTTVAGTSADFRFYAQGGSAPQSFVPFIYSVVAGQPATLLGSGPVITVPAGQPAGWVSGPLTGISLAASTPYMIGVLAGPTGSQAAEFYTTVANGAYWNANTAGYPVPASTWGAINISNQLWDFAVDYTT